MCQSTFTFWYIVTITLDTTKFDIDVRQLQELQEKIKENLNKVLGIHSVTQKVIKEFDDVKLFKVTNDEKNTDGAQHDTATVTVFIQFTTAGQGKDHIQIPSTIYDLYIYILSMTVGMYLSMP